MEHRKDSHAKESSQVRKIIPPTKFVNVKEAGPKAKLEIVLKCDSFGSVEAVTSILNKLKIPGVETKLIQSSVGAVSKSDLLMALTGSKLVVGFGVSIMPKLEQWIKDNGVEVRLYSVIYRLVDDLKRMAQSLIQPEESLEKITGKARVIALFKSSHKGVIVGCEVLEGVLAVGKDFRIIAAMGPVYSGRIDSLHIESDVVKEAKVGQHVGLKLAGFSRVKVGDLVECFEGAPVRRSTAWSPSGAILHFES